MLLKIRLRRDTLHMFNIQPRHVVFSKKSWTHSEVDHHLTSILQAFYSIFYFCFFRVKSLFLQYQFIIRINENVNKTIYLWLTIKGNITGLIPVLTGIYTTKYYQMKVVLLPNDWIYKTHFQLNDSSLWCLLRKLFFTY